MLKLRIFYSRHLVICIILILGFGLAHAQLKIVPVPRQGNPSKTSAASGRTKSLTPMKLPFWDDFSFAGGTTPHDTLWENSNSVYVNNGIGINSPTIYVATLDGLDSLGVPYRPEVLANGFRDKLVSRPIDLSVNNTAVYLSFFYQWQGNGEPPDPSDFLVLEFRNSLGAWIERTRITPRSSFEADVFYDTTLLVGELQYFHTNFQFRFRSYGRQSGPFDTWNIDYVYMNDFRNIVTFGTYPDRAVASELSPLFGEYRSVPLQHFLGYADFSNILFDVQNLKDVSVNAVKYDMTGSFINYQNDAVISDNTVPIYSQPDFAIGSKERLRMETMAGPDTTDVSQFKAVADSIDIRLTAKLISNDELDPERSTFEGIDLRVNDTISSVYHMKNFYAYDDGTAEYAVELTQPGNKALYEFEMLSDGPDDLAGFRIYFPDFGLATGQQIRFLIHTPSGDGPSEDPVFALTLGVNRKGLNNFFNVPLYASLQVQDKFYIGWEAPATGKPKVGFDLSNDTGNRIWTNTNASWQRNADDLHGSLMIRPYFGDASIVGIPGEEEKVITLFPNPNHGEFFIRGKFDAISILSSTGQSISFDAMRDEDKTKISFRAAPGLYLVRLTANDNVITEKIIVR